MLIWVKYDTKSRFHLAFLVEYEFLPRQANLARQIFCLNARGAFQVRPWTHDSFLPRSCAFASQISVVISDDCESEVPQQPQTGTRTSLRLQPLTKVSSLGPTNDRRAVPSDQTHLPTLEYNSALGSVETLVLRSRYRTRHSGESVNA